MGTDSIKAVDLTGQPMSTFVGYLKVIYRVQIYVYLVIALSPYRTVASDGDSTLISQLKKYISAETGFIFKRPFYTTWRNSEEPDIVVYVSSPSKVELPPELYGKINGAIANENMAEEEASKFNSLGYPTFIYKTYGTSAVELSARFLSYSVESKCFIAIHEFIHLYLLDRDIRIPYEYVEALGDVIGNYGAIEFMRAAGYENIKGAKAQKMWVEGAYRTINETIKKVNVKPDEVDELNLRCQSRIEKKLKHGDLFQNDRFGYHVNNAYLLKNSYYSRKYFLLKKLLKKAGSVRELLNIIENGPAFPKAFEEYIHDSL